MALDSIAGQTPSAEIRHPDGSVNVVTVHPTGEIVRSVHFTADDGAKVSILSNGTGWVSEVHEYSDGRVYTETRHPDGTTSRHDSYTDSDGSRVTHTQSPDGSVEMSRVTEANGKTTTERVFADGHRETRTEEDVTLADGTKYHEVKDFDGTKVVLTNRPDGGSVERTTHPDGSEELLTSWPTADGWVTREIGVDGAATVTVLSTDPTTNWATITKTLPDGHTETTSIRTTQNPDGSTTYEHVYPDGRSTTEIHRADGSFDTMEVHPDGTTETSEQVIYPDGRVLVEQVNADGTRETKVSVPHPDGTMETTLHKADGDTIRTVLSPDGSVEREVHKQNDTIERTVLGPDGHGTTTLTSSDGTTTVIDQYPDRALEVDRTLTPDEIRPEPPVLAEIDPSLVDELGDQALTLEDLAPPDFGTTEPTAEPFDSFESDGNLEVPTDLDAAGVDPDPLEVELPVDSTFDSVAEPVAHVPAVDISFETAGEPVSEAPVE